MKTIKEEIMIVRNKGKTGQWHRAAQSANSERRAEAQLKTRRSTGSSVRTAIIKATRSEPLVSKKKHVDYLINTTKSGKPNTHALLAGLRARIQLPDWQVALKGAHAAQCVRAVHVCVFGGRLTSGFFAGLSVTHRMLREAHHSFAVACR